MKKFTKACLITAGVLFSVGFIICMMVLIVGERNDVVYVQNHMLGKKLMKFLPIKVEEPLMDEMQQFMDELPQFMDEIPVNLEGMDLIDDWDESSYTNQLYVNGIKISGNQGTKSFDAAGISELELVCGGTFATIEEREDGVDEIEIILDGKGKCIVEVREGNTLYIEGFRNKYYNGSWPKENQMTIRIPKDKSFDEISGELGACEVDWYQISGREVSFDVGAGLLNLYGGLVDFIDITVGMGEITAEDMEITSGEFEIGMGNLLYDGNITGNLTVECAMGNVELDLVGKETDYNYQIESAAGGVDINGQSILGIGETHKSNGSNKNMDLSCSMGNIAVVFK